MDPNRVLDLILESLEARPSQHQFYTGLLNQYPCESATISELLGFKLNNHASNAKDAKGIYTTIALLIQANILQLSDIYSWVRTHRPSSSSDMVLKYPSSLFCIVLLPSLFFSSFFSISSLYPSLFFFFFFSFCCSPSISSFYSSCVIFFHLLFLLLHLICPSPSNHLPSFLFLSFLPFTRKNR